MHRPRPLFRAAHVFPFRAGASAGAPPKSRRTGLAECLAGRNNAIHLTSIKSARVHAVVGRRRPVRALVRLEQGLGYGEERRPAARREIPPKRFLPSSPFPFIIPGIDQALSERAIRLSNTPATFRHIATLRNPRD